MINPANTSDNYNDLAKKIFDIVAVHCKFPAAVVATHCKAINRTPQTITPADIHTLAPKIGNAVAMFTNPIKGQQVETAILQLRP